MCCKFVVFFFFNENVDVLEFDLMFLFILLNVIGKVVDK